jgi:hypothetical protein
MLLSAREAMADFLNASSAEVAFGNNMTTLTFHLARALGAAWEPGDEVLVTELEHHANIAPWQRLERERGIVVKSAGVRRGPGHGGELDWVDGHWEQVDEDDLIDDLEDDVMYDEKGVPRDPVTGEELHYVCGRWQRLPATKATDAPASSQAPLRFDKVG